MVTTYGDLGMAVNCRSGQAIGQALKKNPFAPNVPCHRVIQKLNYGLGGFNGSVRDSELIRKINLLQKEGIEFDGKTNDGINTRTNSIRIKSEFIFQWKNS